MTTSVAAAAAGFALMTLTSASVEVTALDPPASLAGAWRCLPLQPAAAPADSDASTVAQLSSPPADDDAAGGWVDVTMPQSQDDAGVGACSAAAVWLRVDVKVRLPEPRAGAPLGVSLGEVHGAYAVFVDGTRVGGRGTIDADPRAIVDALREGVAFPVPPDATRDGAVRVDVLVVRDPAALATTQDRRVIVGGPLALGGMPGVHDRAASEVALRVHREIAVSLACGVLFLFVALYHLLVWLLRRDLLGYLWFGIFTLTADMWLTIVAVASTPVLPWSARFTAIVGNFVGSLVNAAFIEFFFRYLMKSAPTRGWRVWQALVVVVAFIGFIPGVGVEWTTSIPVVLIKTVWIVGLLYLCVKSARRSVEGRVLLSALVLAVVVAPLEYIVRTRGLHLAISPAQLSLAVFFIVMAIGLAAQFARTLDAVDARARELADTNRAIQRFVPFLFLKALAKESVREVNRGDAAKASMSVMFCDLRGFTTLAEKMGPQATFGFINRYLERMEPEIHKTGGFINQYLGDGIMALFPKGADAAVDAAVAMARALEKLNAERVANGEVPIKIGIGIHTGDLMIGTIGGGDQLDSGVVGDVVNTAARLEGITKMYSAMVLISGPTMQALRDPASRHLRPLDAVRAKGKSEPLPLVEVLDAEPRERRERKVASRGEMEQALALYRQGKFADAAVRFGALAARDPDDGAVRAFAERCREMTAAPPDAWDGVWSLTTK